jgi:hypothetical protein
MLLLTSIFERLKSNSDKKRLIGVVFLAVAKAFDTVWAKLSSTS